MGFEEAFETYRDAVVQTAALYTRNRHEAEDIAQETFLRYYLYSRNVRVSKVKTWLMTVAKNLTYNYIKKHYREIPIDMTTDAEAYLEMEENTENVFFEKMWNKEVLKTTNIILDALHRKNEKWFDAVTYVYCMEVSHRKAAKYMGISEDALQSMLYRARKWIKKQYQEEFDHIIER